MWVGMGNPCDDADYNFFYASSTIIVGNGARTPFWDSPWVHNRKPMDLAPLIYAASTSKNWKVREALKDGAWVKKIKMTSDFSIEHFRQFLELWATIRDFHLQEDIDDDIVWKHSTSGLYTVESAYKAQFLGLIRSPLEHAVWKIWALPKVKSLLGWPSKIESGLRIVWPSAVGLTVAHAPYACVRMNRLTISSSNVVSPFAYGAWSRRGCNSFTLTPLLGP